MGGLRVYPENMKRNLEMTKRTLFQSVDPARAYSRRTRSQNGLRSCATRRDENLARQKILGRKRESRAPDHGQVIRERDRQTLLHSRPISVTSTKNLRRWGWVSPTSSLRLDRGKCEVRRCGGIDRAERAWFRNWRRLCWRASRT